MATETEELVLSISADTAQIKRALQRLTGETKQAAAAIEGSLAGVDAGAAKAANSIARGSQQIGQSMGKVRASAANLQFQLNDIAQGLLSGTSPFTIMVQQGSQVSQALQSMGGGLGTIKGIGSAFLGMLSPISLATMALIYLSGKAVKFFTTTEDGGKEAAKTLKEQRDLIRQVAQQWGDALPALKDYNDELQRQEDIASQLEAVAAAIKQTKADMQAAFAGVAPDVEKVLGLFAAFPQLDITPLLEDFDKLQKKVEDGTATADELRDMADRLRKVLANLPVKLGTELAAGFDAAISKMIELAEQSERLGKSVGTIKDGYAELSRMISATPLTVLSPLTSGGGQFLDPQQLQDFRANAANVTSTLDSGAAELIKAEEGFIDAARWDVNAFRVGFGSDTYVDEMGKVQKVTKIPSSRCDRPMPIWRAASPNSSRRSRASRPRYVAIVDRPATGRADLDRLQLWLAAEIHRHGDPKRRRAAGRGAGDRQACAPIPSGASAKRRHSAALAMRARQSGLSTNSTPPTSGVSSSKAAESTQFRVHQDARPADDCA